MEQKHHINVSIIFEEASGKYIDLRIPKQITVYRLMKEINQIFQRENQRGKYQLKVKNKGILLDEECRLSEYPLTNGDVIQLLGE